MHRNNKKRGSKNKKLNIAIVLAVAVLVALILFVSEKPSITGLVVVTKESSHSDSLNLIVNESKDVIWNVRNPGNLQSIKANGKISRNGTAKVYLEKDNEKFLIFDSTKQLFDVNVEVLPDYKKIFQGEELLIQIVLFNLRGFGRADVNVEYSIKDPNGNLIATQEEVVTVETQAKFVRKLLIPSDLKPGTYVAFVEVTTPDGLVGTSSDSFEVSTKFEELDEKQIKYYILGIIFLPLLVIIVISLLQLYKILNKGRKLKDIKEKTLKEKIQKLEKELAALESAYNSKFISEESYKKDEERLENKLQGLRGQTNGEKAQEKVKEEKTAEEIVKEAIKEDKESLNEQK